MPDWETGADAAAIAENYARYLLPAFFTTLASETLKHAQVRPGDTALDVACGTGVVTFEVAQLVGELGRAVGVDIDPTMLAIAERIRTSRAGLTEQQATAQRRPAVEEVRLDVSCPAQESSVKRFIRKQTLRKVVTVRFSNVDRDNRPMADVFLPGGRSLKALVQTRFPPRP